MKNDTVTIVKKIMEEGFSKANLQVIDQYVSDNFIEHQFGAKNGKEGLKGIILQLHSGFSNLQYTLQRCIPDGNTVWAHYKATAIHSGIFMNLPPSGIQISIDVMDIFRFENGLLAEHWGVPDRFAVMMQLGVFNKKVSAA